MGNPGTKSHQMGVSGLICGSLAVLDVKNHWLKAYIKVALIHFTTR